MSVVRAQDNHRSVFDVSKVDALPPLPETGMKIIQSFGDEFLDGNIVADIVAGDPAITARLIGIANSSYFNLQEPVTDMRQVVNRVLGVDTVRTMAFALAVKRSFDTSQCPNFDAGVFWQQAMSLADACQKMAKQSTLSGEAQILAHTLGLCSGLGSLALAALEPLRLNTVLDEHDAHSQDIDAAVSAEFGVSAAAITASLAHSWSMPEILVAAYQALAMGDPAAAPMSALILCARSATDEEHAREIGPEWLDLLGLSAEQVADIGTGCITAKDASIAGSLLGG
ncbi:MAG: HDOD domain-containing protein [Pseudomonadota bacterium]